MTFVFNLNTVHPHGFTIDDWASSILENSTPPTHYNWVDDPLRERKTPEDWLVTRSQDDIDTFYNVATGMLLGLDAIKFRPELTSFTAKATPRHLWAIFCSPWAWTWEMFDWNTQWEIVLRRCAKTFNGYPLDALPFRIPTIPDHTGEYVVTWNVPHRWCLQASQARVDGYHTELTRLRVWNLISERCLLTNSNWEGVTITNSTFIRCTFRDTDISNVHFMNCHITDVDFHGVILRDSLISNCTLAATSFSTCEFQSSSWGYNHFENTTFENVTSQKSNWTYIYYSGMLAKDYFEERKTANWVKLSNCTA